MQTELPNAYDAAFAARQAQTYEDFAAVQTFTVNVTRWDEGQVGEAIVKLNKKLKRYNGVVRIVSRREYEKPHFMVVSRKVPMVELIIEAPAVAGVKAKLVGSFELAEDDKSVYASVVPGYDEHDLDPFRHRAFDCDHCQKKRHRHASFVCELPNGERKVIGRQCSLDYIGVSPAELLARAAVSKTLNGDDEDPDRPFGGSGGTFYNTVELVDAAYQVGKRYGGYSRDLRDDAMRDVNALLGAKDYGKSTVNADLRAFYKEKAYGKPDYQALADYLDKATGDFGDNLRIALSIDYVKPKRLMLIVAGVGLFVGRAIKQAVQAEVEATKPPAKHLDGAEGARVEFFAVIEKMIPMRSDFGPKSLVIMLVDDGSRVIHFNTGVLPDAGERYKVKATIKKHDVSKYNQQPETTVSRAVYTKEG